MKEQMDPSIRDTFDAFENLHRMSSLRLVNAHERREHKATIHHLNAQRDGIDWNTGDMLPSSEKNKPVTP